MIRAGAHGCVLISPQNAATLYALVTKSGLKNTQVVLAGDAPGGEAKLASKSRSGTRYSQNTRRSFEPRHDYYAEGAAGFSDGCLAACNRAAESARLRAFQLNQIARPYP
jgi:hypothetical protein